MFYKVTSFPTALLLTLLITAFTLCLAASHEGVFLQKALPLFLLIMGSALQILSGVKQLDRAFEGGVMSVWLGCGHSSQRYVAHTLLAKVLWESLPISVVFGFLLWTQGYPLALALSVFFLTSLMIQPLCLILAGLRIQQKISGMLAIFLLWPFLIPSLLLALLSLESGPSASLALSLLDMLFLMSALALIMSGMALLLTPRLIRLAYEG